MIDGGSEFGAGGAMEGVVALEADLSEALSGRGGAGKRICIATPDILGPVKNGGIGTAYHHMARALARWGHEVVIAFVSDQAADAGAMERTRALYAGFGISVEPIVPQADNDYIVSRVRAPTWALHDWLRARERPFDIVHVPDWRGLGYGALLAKSLGVAFAQTHFVVVGHSTTLWAAQGNGQLLSREQQLGWVFMERRSVELADTVICVSAHLLRWMRAAGYAMPQRSFVWPNLFPVPDSSPEAVRARGARDGARLEEVVFFGRLEPRKGLVVFIDAIDRLARGGRAPARVTFLGKVSSHIDGLDLIRGAARHWPVEVRTLTDCGAEEAVAYLSQPGRLAVVPSLLENCSMAVLECLQAGIPFVAAATGGTPELVAPEDRDRALVAPEHIALGERVAELAATPLRAVRPRRDFARCLEVWSHWHAQSAPFEASAAHFARRAKAARAETPPVTVCIVHHERPALLRMAIDSVLEQDYPAFDAVLVDDGSESAAALQTLDAVEAQFAPRGWRVLRQENRYAGAARNTAASAARGEWLLFLDDDNVLFPDAITRLVRAALFCGAHCVPASAIRFSGNGDPRHNTASHGHPVRFLGAARAWNRLRNVAGDTCALVRRDTFHTVGGYPEEFRLWLQDMCFNNRLIHAGYRIEPLPDPVYYYRIAPLSPQRNQRPSETARARALSPFLLNLESEERAFLSFSTSCIRSQERLAPQPHRKAHAMAFARRPSVLGRESLELRIVLDPTWAEHIRRRPERSPVVELRRNGRVLERLCVHDLHHDAISMTQGLRPPMAYEALYSVHDIETGEILTSIIASPLLRTRKIIGAVENRQQLDVRGWALDASNPERPRRVALFVDGRLREVIDANLERADIALWKGTSGLHGFLWRIPESVPVNNGVQIDVLDAHTGRPLRGSPLRIDDGKITTSVGRKT